MPPRQVAHENPEAHACPNVVAALAFDERDTPIKHVCPIPVEDYGVELLNNIKRYELNGQAGYVRCVPQGDGNLFVAMAHDVQIPDMNSTSISSPGATMRRYSSIAGLQRLYV